MPKCLLICKASLPSDSSKNRDLHDQSLSFSGQCKGQNQFIQFKSSMPAYTFQFRPVVTTCSEIATFGARFTEHTIRQLHCFMSAVDQPVGPRLWDALCHPHTLLQLGEQRDIATQHRNTSCNSGVGKRCQQWYKIDSCVMWWFLIYCKKKKLTSQYSRVKDLTIPVYRAIIQPRVTCCTPEEFSLWPD